MDSVYCGIVTDVSKAPAVSKSDAEAGGRKCLWNVEKKISTRLLEFTFDQIAIFRVVITRNENKFFIKLHTWEINQII